MEHINGNNRSFNYVPERNDDRTHVQGDNEFMPSLQAHSHEGN